MDPECPCQCSMEALQMMTEFRNIRTVMDLGTILDIVHRVHRRGQTIVNCGGCQKNPQSAIVTLPALVEQCLSLFEAACSTYNIARGNVVFDPAAPAFELPFPRFICVKSKTVLGQMELDDEETGQLVKMLLNRNLAGLLELLEMLKDFLRVWSKDIPYSHRVGTTTLRACESSVESTIHRVAALMEQTKIEPTINRPT